MESAISSSTIRSFANDATRAVENQIEIIASMRSCDPCLPFANLMLCLMQQSAATAGLNLVFYPLLERNDRI